MCGRYASFRENQDLADAFAIASFGPDVDDWTPSWNVAPTDRVRIVVDRPLKDAGPEPVRQLQSAAWGLVPSWAKDPAIGSRMINARLETLAEKASFKRPLAVRRCLLPADGYFEWLPAEKGKRKQPVYLHAAEPLAFAGLYEFWRAGPQAPWLVSTTIITTDARGVAGHVHDRQPVMLDSVVWDTWLDPALTDPQDALALLDPMYQAQDLVATLVSTEVNSVANNGPELITPIGPDQPA